jgi:putative transposase
MSRYRFIKAQQGTYPVRGLCRALGVAPSHYYAWQQGQQRAVGEITPAWETALVAMFARHKSRYSTHRLRAALHQEGHRMGRQALRTALVRRGLRALQPKAYTLRTNDSTHSLRCAPNRLLD